MSINLNEVVNATQLYTNIGLTSMKKLDEIIDVIKEELLAATAARILITTAGVTSTGCADPEKCECTKEDESGQSFPETVYINRKGRRVNRKFHGKTGFNKFVKTNAPKEGDVLVVYNRDNYHDSWNLGMLVGKTDRKGQWYTLAA